MRLPPLFALILAPVWELSFVPASACELDPLTLPIHSQGTFPVGSQQVATDTHFSVVFVPTSPGKVRIVRNDETVFYSLSEKISAEIDKSDNQTLPKDQCNFFARVTSRSIGPTPPSYSISVTIVVKVAVCTPQQVPCPQLNELEPSFINTAFAPELDDSSSAEPDQGHFQTAQEILNIMTHKPSPSPGPGPHLVPKQLQKQIQKLQPPSLLKPPVTVKMCDAPFLPKIRVPLGSGIANMNYTLNGNYNKTTGVPFVSSAQNPNFQLDAKTAPLKSLLNGFITKFGIEKTVTGLLSKNANLVPATIAVPKGPRPIFDLTWTTRSAQFGIRSGGLPQLPAFIVVRDADETTVIACLARALWSKPQ